MTRQYAVPGRVELVGKHVDYAGGRSLTCAVDMCLTLLASPLNEPVIRVRDQLRQQQVSIALSAAAVASRLPWTSYIAAVARRFARDFPNATRGVSIDLLSTLPHSAGLSSSSALIVGVATALADANEMEQNAEWHALLPDLASRAEYFGAMETGAPFGAQAGDDGVGVRGGAQDHVAILCAEEHSVSQFSYIPARLERRVRWPAEYVLAIGVSSMRATKTGNARALYNRASDAMRALTDAWNATEQRSDVTLAAALASQAGAAGVIAAIAEKGVPGFSARYLAPRFAQFVEETEIIVPNTAQALETENFSELSRLVDRSQALAESALGNQIAETIFLQRTARELGAAAASAFGAGFGGSVWAMIRRTDANYFLNAWRERYEREFPDVARLSQWHVTRPSAPLRSI